MRRLAMLPLLLLALPHPAAANYDWTANYRMLTGPALPRCQVGMARVWSDGDPATSPIHIRLRNNAMGPLLVTWHAAMPQNRGGDLSLGGGAVAIPANNYGVVQTRPPGLGNLTGSRIIVTIDRCDPL